MGMKKYQYILTNPEQRVKREARYEKFIEILNDVHTTPILVFDPLPQQAIYELELIRELSKDLQQKKIEDMQKAAKAAEEAKQLAEKEEQEKKKEEQKNGSEA